MPVIVSNPVFLNRKGGEGRRSVFRAHLKSEVMMFKSQTTKIMSFPTGVPSIEVGKYLALVEQATTSGIEEIKPFFANNYEENWRGLEVRVHLAVVVVKEGGRPTSPGLAPTSKK